MEHRRCYSPNILTGFSNIILRASVFVCFVYISHDGVGLCLICDLSLVVCLSNLKRLIPALSLPSFSSLHHHFAFFPHILRLTPPSLSFFVSFPPASSPSPLPTSCLPPSFLLSIPPLLTLSSPLPVALGRNQPLKRERPKWKSDYPMTEGQLRSKRDEFWDTAPAFEGRKEIWDALRAAASAFESNDHLLAQAILDGASITLPHGNAHFTVERSRHLIVFYSPWSTAGWTLCRTCSGWLPPQEFQLPLPKSSRAPKTQELSCSSCFLC